MRTSDRAAYAADVLTSLYPAPLHVGRSAAGDVVHARYLLLPTPGHARVVAPAGHPGASADAISRQLAGGRPRTRFARLLLTRALRTGSADRLARGGLVVSGPRDADSIERVLGAATGCEHVLLTLPVSPPRANRKPVLQVSDDAGNALAFVKVGHDELTRRLVLAEGSRLQQLATVPWLRVQAPVVLGQLEWRDLTLLLLEPLPLAGVQLSGGPARTALLSTVREIAAIGGLRTVPWTDTDFRAGLERELAGCGPLASRFGAHLAELTSVPTELTMGAWHGDLNPGNIALLPTRSLVWDWERFEHGVPLGFDVLHHDLHSTITLGRTRPARAARRLIRGAARSLAELGIDPVAADVTVRVYLLTLAARYLRDRQSEAGAVLGDVDTWLLPALDAAGRPGR